MDEAGDEAGGEGRRINVSIVLSIGIAVFMAADLYEDYSVGLELGHALIEMAVVVLAIAHAVVLLQRIRAGRARAVELTRDLEATRREAEHWRAEAKDALRSLGGAIDQQLVRWNLTDAERDVALLLLKGLAHKEIASLRQTSAETVRQQALAVYRKSGLGGRSALAAFFLEDLLLPERGGRAAAGRKPTPA